MNCGAEKSEITNKSVRKFGLLAAPRRPGPHKLTKGLLPSPTTPMSSGLFTMNDGRAWVAWSVSHFHSVLGVAMKLCIVLLPCEAPSFVVWRVGCGLVAGQPAWVVRDTPPAGS